ncbi:MAG: GNAT family N-acetyltransferase [Chitinophagaceae bacterium]
MKDLSIQWQCKYFNDLTNLELYQILKLRSLVFVVEQNCVYQDIDDIDINCYHFFATNQNNEIVAYTRLIAPTVVYHEMSIGRVITHPNFRKLQLGKQLIANSILQCFKLFGKGAIKIGAQLYLKKFYEGFGFIKSSDIYLEDGIEHIKMIRSLDY